jgi:hypothetical protein
MRCALLCCACCAVRAVRTRQALNDLFVKIMERDVPERYLLRLGMGEAELDAEQVGAF